MCTLFTLFVCAGEGRKGGGVVAMQVRVAASSGRRERVKENPVNPTRNNFPAPAAAAAAAVP